MQQSSPVIMFDLDGTLFDTAQAIPVAFNAAFRESGLREQPAAAIRETIGLPLETAFARLPGLTVDHPQVIRAVEAYQHQFKKVILPVASDLLFAGVNPGLQILKAAGFRLAVTTNKFSHSANTLLAAAGIAQFFEIVVGADDVTHKKPHPESGQKILDFMRLSASQAMMVGDTTHDILMANNLGCQSIAVTYGIHSHAQLASATPDFFASSFSGVVETCCRNAAVLAPAVPCAGNEQRHD